MFTTEMDLSKKRINNSLLCVVKSNCLLLLFSCLCHFSFAQKNPNLLYTEIKEMAHTDPEKAAKMILSYKNMGEELKSAEIAAKTNYLFGLTNYFRSRFYISNQYYTAAVNSGYAKSDLAFEGICHNNMGINYEIQNLIPQSLESYQKSLRISEQLKDSVGIGQCWINIGLLNAKLKRFEYAETLTWKALNFFSRKSDTLNMALCYQNLGFIFSDEKRSEMAIDYFGRSLKLNQAINNPYDVVSGFYNLGSEYAVIHQNATSDNYLWKALKLALEQGRTETVVKIYMQLGENYTNAGNYKSAEAYLKKASKMLDAGDIDEIEYLVFGNLKNLYAKSGNYKAYSQTVKEYDKRRKRKIIPLSHARVDELQALYEFNKNTSRIKQQAKDIATQQKQKKILIGVFALIGIVLSFVLYLHLRMRRYMRSLFENKVEKTAKSALISDGKNTEPDNKTLFELYTRIVVFLQDNSSMHEKEPSISVLANQLQATEVQVSDALRIYGKNENSHVFFQSFYIDDICKQLISKGKKLPLSEIIRESPFSSFREFSRKFKEMTGLSPEQFASYSEERLKKRS